MLLKFLILIIIIYIKSIFTSSETAFTYLRKAKINQESKSIRADKKTKRIKELLDNKNKLFGTTKVGVTIIELFASVFAVEAFVNNMVKWLQINGIDIALAYFMSIIIVTIILSYFTLVFGELIPKRIARSHPEKTAYRNINKIYLISKINYAFEKLLIASENIFIKLLNLEKDLPEKLTERELKLIIAEGKDQGIYDEDEKRLLNNALKFDNLKAKDIMIPKDKIKFINIKKDYNEIIQEIVECKYTRIPVYEKSKDNIIGILNVKDIIFENSKDKNKEIDLRALLREPLYSRKDEYIDNIFKELSLNKKHMTIIKQDDKVLGIITMEDILEKIVGNIYDEFEDRK